MPSKSLTGHDVQACMQHPLLHAASLAYFNLHFCNATTPNALATYHGKLCKGIANLSSGELALLEPLLPNFLSLSACKVEMLCAALRVEPDQPGKGLKEIFEEHQYALNASGLRTKEAYMCLHILKAFVSHGSTLMQRLVAADTAPEEMLAYLATAPQRAPFDAAWAPPSGAIRLPKFSVEDGGWASCTLWVQQVGADEWADSAGDKVYDPDAQLRLLRHRRCPLTGDDVVEPVCAKTTWTPQQYSSSFMPHFRRDLAAHDRALRKLAYVQSADDSDDKRRMGVRVVDPSNPIRLGNVEWMPCGQKISEAWADPTRDHTWNGKRKRDENGALEARLSSSTQFRKLQYTKHLADGTCGETARIVNGRVLGGTHRDGELWVSNNGVFLDVKRGALASSQNWDERLATSQARAYAQSEDVNFFDGRIVHDYLSFGWKSFTGLVHQAVAQTFIGSPPNDDYATYSVDHVRNADKLDNTVHVDESGEGCLDHRHTNLRWASAKAQAMNRGACGRMDGREVDANDATQSAVSPQERARLKMLCPASVRDRLSERLAPSYETAALQFLVAEPETPCDRGKLLHALECLEWSDVPEKAWSAVLPQKLLRRVWSDGERRLMARSKRISGDDWKLMRTYLLMQAHHNRPSRAVC